MEFINLILNDPKSTLTKAQKLHLKKRLNVVFPNGSFRCTECGNAVTEHFNHSGCSRMSLLCSFCNRERFD